MNKKNNGMSMVRGWLAVAMLAAVVANGVAEPGDPPNLISYQGYLVDLNAKPLGTTPGGDPNPTTYDVQFSIFASATGGSPLWSEQQTITVDSGYFSVYPEVPPLKGGENALSSPITGPFAAFLRFKMSPCKYGRKRNYND